MEARATTFRSIDLGRNFTSTWTIPGCEIGRYVTPLMSYGGTGSRGGRTQREFEEDGIENERLNFFFSFLSFFFFWNFSVFRLRFLFEKYTLKRGGVLNSLLSLK